MQENKKQFLTAVLGIDGAEALCKAADISKELENAIVPRAIFAWVDTVGRYSFEGAVPGIDNSYIAFTKSDKGFSGRVNISNEMYSFSNETVFNVGGAIACVLGMEHQELSKKLRDVDVERLGKTVDLLVRAHVVVLNLKEESSEETSEETSEESSTSSEETSEETSEESSTSSEETSEETSEESSSDGEEGELEKKGMESKGATAAPLAPAAAVAPIATAPKAPKATAPKASTKTASPSMGMPKATKPINTSTVKLTQSEANKKCDMCGESQLRDGELQGCHCLSGLFKNTEMVETQEGFILRLSSDWDRAAVLTLMDIVGRN